MRGMEADLLAQNVHVGLDQYLDLVSCQFIRSELRFIGDTFSSNL